MQPLFGATSVLRCAAAVAAAVLSLAACGTSAPSGGGNATSGEVTWWGESIEIATAQDYIAEFNKEFPDIKVTYKKFDTPDWEAALRPALASPSGPDVFELLPGSRVAAFGSFAEDMTPVAEEALGSDWKEKVSPLGVEGLTFEGKLVSLSMGAVYSGSLWINQRLFDESQLQPPTTLDEWIHVCEAFKANNVGCFVQGAAQAGFDGDTMHAIADRVEPGLWTKASKGEAHWNDPGIVKAFEIWKALFDEGIMQEGAIGYQQYPDANNAFLAEKYAMVMMGTWYMQYATTDGIAAGISAAGVTGVEPYPIVPIDFPDVAGMGNPPALSGDADIGLSVSLKAANKAAATTLVKWLTTTQKGQQLVANALGVIPALNGVTPDWQALEMPDKDVQLAPIQKLMADSFASSDPRLRLLTADMKDAILTACTSVADGAATPQEAADTLQATAEDLGQTFTN